MNNPRKNVFRTCWQKLLAAAIIFTTIGSAGAANIVQEFYLPMPEAQIYQSDNTIVSGTPSTVASTFSIIVTGNGTIIYYDQWEDGYETDLGNPTQSTTQIWGDGVDAHGIPPGFAHNPLGLSAGTIITLTNNVTQPRNPSTLLWDARDRIGANKALIISRAGWPYPTGPVFAGAVSVLSTMDYGTNYISPVGQNLTNINLMKYVGMFIMAAQDNTSVTIDPNGNGIGTTNIVLNQGESYLVNGGIMVGGRVTSSEPIQADLVIGHVGAEYASDWFTLYPVTEWSSSYYTPVGSAAKQNQPAYVYIYNPNTTAITINYNSRSGSGSFSVPASNGVFQFQMPVSSGASFVSAGGQNFYALCTVAANNSSDTPYNWGFTLVPQGALTTQAQVGWAPGSSDDSVDGSPVWVTTLANTTVYVDYHGDTNGPYIDPIGNHYDTNFAVTALQSLKIFDPSKDQSGMKVYTVDGTLLTAAWGEDADTAAPGNPYIDAGTTVIPFPVPLLKKTAAIVTNVGGAGTLIGDTILYTVEVDNKGLLPLGNTVVIDAPSGNLTYITNSTTFDGSPIPDSAGSNVFPLSSPGYTIPVILSQGTSTFTYLAKVNAAGIVSNSVDIGGTTIISQAIVTPPPTNGASVTLNFSDTNGVPVSLYAVGADVFVTMTNAAGNTSSNTIQTISVTVNDTNSGDVETIVLAETGNNTGVFRNTVGLPTSSTSGLSQQDGKLYVFPGDTLSVSYTDPNFGDSASATATIQIPALTKQLYLSVNGSTNGTQDLNRIDPIANGHGPSSTSVGIGTAGGTIAVDSTSSGGANSGTTLTISHTTSGANRLMLVGVSFQDDKSASANLQSITSVTYNGVNLALVASNGTASSSQLNAHNEIWSLANPATGTYNVVVTYSQAYSIVAGVTTFTGVNTNAPFRSTNSVAGFNASASVTSTSASGDIVFSTLALGTNSSSSTWPGTITPGSGQVSQWTNLVEANSSSYRVTGAGSTSNSLASTVNSSWSWTAGPSSAYALTAVSIIPATGGGGGPATNVTTFVQTPAFASAFTIQSNSLITITNYLTVTNGSLPMNPAVTAALQYNGTNIITLSNPTYSSTSNTLVWNGSLTTNVTVPAGAVISYVVSNGQSGTAFYIDYDSTNVPSKITLPTMTVIAVGNLGVYDGPYPGGNLVTSPVAGSTLYVRTYVTDPFGSYDINGLTLAVTGPAPGSSFTNTLGSSNVVASDSLSKTYEYPWATGPAAGSYSIAATAHEGTEGITASAAASITTTFLDLGTPSSTEFITGSFIPTNSYPAGSSVCVSVTALDSITNTNVIQTIVVAITSSAGDLEDVTLTETAANTGVYTGCINTTTNGPGVTNNGTLYAPVGSILTASYTDPNSSSYSSSATATIQPAPGVPGVTINKTILSPSGGQVGVGQAVTFNLQIVNSGSTTLPGLGITDSFPSATLSYSTASLAPSTVASGLLTWTNFGAFAPGQSTNITVTFTTVATGTATNSATANGVSATNSSSVVLAINKAALNVTKTLLSPASQPVGVGSNVVFRITVQNIGSTVVNYLPMEDSFSGAYYQFVSATIPPNGSGAGSLVWTNLAYPTPLATNATITNTVTMLVVGQGSPANNTATVDYATDVFGNAVPASSSTVGVATASASITGHVYNDLNKNGVYTNGDLGLSGVALQLYNNPSGDGNPADGTLNQIATTDANGFYQLLNLNTGHYVIVETLLPGYVGSAPANNKMAVNVTSLSATTNANFFQYVPAPSLYSTISGTVWSDTNGIGTNGPGEAGIPNIEMDLVQDLNSNGVVDPGEPVASSVNTDANGNYSFSGVTPGSYVIHEIIPFGYYSTGDSQGRRDGEISFSSTNGVVSTNNSFYDRLSPTAVADTNSTVYGVPVVIDSLTNDISPYGDALTITNVTTTNGIAVINPGSTNITFTPTNTGATLVNYTIADAHGGTSTTTISVSVALAPLSVTASNASRVFGQTNPVFSGTLMGVTNGDNITATFSTTATTNSPAGNYAIVPTLVDPNHRLTNYTVTTNNGTLTITSASSLVTWTNPVPVIYGTPLSTNQLDAIASVPGTFVYNPTNGTVLNTGSNTLSVVFTPTDTNDYNSSTNTVTLVVQPAPLSVTASNASRIYGQTNPVFSGTLMGVTNGDNITATFSTTATTNSPAGNYAIVPTLVDPNHRLTNYTVTTNDGTLTITSASSLVTWTNPVPVIYGTPLGTNQLDALASVPGTFVYNPTNGTVLNTGSNTLSVVFTPTDTNDYNSSTNTVTLVVQPAPLTVTASNASRVYGQTNPVFSGTLMGVTNGDNITATFSTTATTNSPAGNYAIVPTLVDPNHRLTNYTVTTNNGTLTITSASSLVTWTNPVPVIYGTPLGTNQLDALASVPGMFVYNPTNGTVLNTGSNTLSVVFTPTDTNDYNSSTNTVTLVVQPAPLSVTASNASRIYGQTNPVFSGTLMGVTNGDNITATFSTTATTNSPAGNYPIIPALLDPNHRLTNYTVTTNNGTLTIVAGADIAVFDSGPTNIVPNQVITYTITVTNLGPATATGVVLTDDLSSYVTFVSASGGGTTNGDVVTWFIGSLTNGQASNVTVTVIAPASGSITNIASATSTSADPNPSNNNGSEGASQVSTTITPPQFGILAGTNALNPQTGLYEEVVVVTNTGAVTVLGVRLYVGGLPSGVILYNASGTNAGVPYAQYNSSLNPQQTVTFTLEFYNPLRTSFTNTLTAVAITNPLTFATNSAGSTPITRVFMDSRTAPPRFVIEFTTVPGNTYTIIYSDDMTNWNVATPSITAGSTSTQWYDDGPPETDSAPTNGGRFYGIIVNP